MRIFEDFCPKFGVLPPENVKNIHLNDIFMSETEFLFEVYKIIYFPSHKVAKCSKNSLKMSNFGQN